MILITKYSLKIIQKYVNNFTNLHILKLKIPIDNKLNQSKTNQPYRSFDVKIP